MSLFITALASGSNGNCYYVGNEREAVLIDAGVSCREIEKRMRRFSQHIKHKKEPPFVRHVVLKTDNFDWHKRKG